MPNQNFIPKNKYNYLFFNKNPILKKPENDNQVNNNFIIDEVSEMMNGKDTPPNLKDYLNRAYQKCINPIEKQTMDKFLRNIIKIAKLQNEIFIKDWKNYSLPILPRERNQINTDPLTNFNENEIKVNSLESN